jgi:hypothetical protein
MSQTQDASDRPAAPAVVQEAHAQRGAFVMSHDGARLAELVYTLDGDTAVLVHTLVDPALRGTGAGTLLVEAAVAWARREHLRLVSHCSFARAVLAKRPDLSDVVVPG